MGFFVDNWLWFLIIGVIILMTLIGYIAEKTDFGRKDVQQTQKTKKPKEEKIKKEKTKKEKITKEKGIKKNNTDAVEKLDVEQSKPEVQLSLATDSILEIPADKLEQNKSVLESETANSKFDENTFKQTTDFAEQLEKFDDNVIDSSDLNNLTVVNQLNNKEVIEDIGVPFDEMIFEEPVGIVEKNSDSELIEKLKFDNSNINVELPDLDSIMAEEDSDDVWKF